jgi:hypothetical protein
VGSGPRRLTHFVICEEVVVRAEEIIRTVGRMEDQRGQLKGDKRGKGKGRAEKRWE